MHTTLLALAVAATLTTTLAAQTTPSAAKADVRTHTAIETQGETLLAQALKAPSGLATVTLETYPGHFTMLTARSHDGGAEVHAGWSDIFIVEDGEATILVGGTVVDAKETSPGETRGSRVEGGTPHLLRKGDVMHISPTVPHQTLVAPGKTFVYYVIKVVEPAKATEAAVARR